jgi:Cof subfamily protein (haloacid dehalogenase superfamily)
VISWSRSMPDHEPSVVQERGLDRSARPSGAARPAKTQTVSEPPAGWRPRLIALDIDGTLLRWVDGQGATHEEISAPVAGAVRRALDAGAHIVLSSGRSAHSMMPVADLLGLPDAHDEVGRDRLWFVASNGAVVFRYPPFEVVHEVTFDARQAVAAVLQEHPEALVAVEDRDQQGYRLNRHFPEGELSGQMTITSIDEMVAEPVSRVIIRDPAATADDFVAMASRLGLHGTDYVVGWTAWLDLTPVGVSKASGLRHVAEALDVARDEALAIGDGRNDLEMLDWAARGVAMGQAVEEVRAAADAVTATVDEDGVAVELSRYFPA